MHYPTPSTHTKPAVLRRPPQKTCNRKAKNASLLLCNTHTELSTFWTYFGTYITSNKYTWYLSQNGYPYLLQTQLVSRYILFCRLDGLFCKLGHVVCRIRFLQISWNTDLLIMILTRKVICFWTHDVGTGVVGTTWYYRIIKRPAMIHYHLPEYLWDWVSPTLIIFQYWS